MNFLKFKTIKKRISKKSFLINNLFLSLNQLYTFKFTQNR